MGISPIRRMGHQPELLFPTVSSSSSPMTSPSSTTSVSCQERSSTPPTDICGILVAPGRIQHQLADPEMLDTSSALHRYGPGYRSPQEGVTQCLGQDQAFLSEYMRSNSELASRVAFFKKERRKKRTDSHLIQDYRFLVSLHTLQKKTFGVRFRSYQ